MTFTNECGCIFDKDLLEKAVDKYCKRNNVYCNDKHRIVLHNNYPTIVISRKHLYVHDLIRAYLYHTRKDFVVHHADFNKLNNSAENLMYITKSRHTKIHATCIWQKIKAENIEVKRSPVRKDILDDDIRRMKEEGIPVSKMAKILNCHYNTIYNRLQKMGG